MGVEITTENGIRIDKKDYREFTMAALKVLKRKKESVGILFTDNAGIKKYNKAYRAKNKPTDVLSFPDDDENSGYLGDIIVSYEWVRETAKLRERTKQARLLIVHSLLHLTGTHHDYDDESLKEIWAQMDIIYNKAEKLLK